MKSSETLSKPAERAAAEGASASSPV